MQDGAKPTRRPRSPAKATAPRAPAAKPKEKSRIVEAARGLDIREFAAAILAGTVAPTVDQIKELAQGIIDRVKPAKEKKPKKTKDKKKSGEKKKAKKASAKGEKGKTAAADAPARKPKVQLRKSRAKT